MMSMISKETKHLINKGLKPENIHNPYIYEMWQKNKFKLGEHITSIDAAFYIVPMINAIQRSGTIEENYTHDFFTTEEAIEDTRKLKVKILKLNLLKILIPIFW